VNCVFYSNGVNLQAEAVMDDGRSGLVTDSKERQKALAAALAQIESSSARLDHATRRGEVAETSMWCPRVRLDLDIGWHSAACRVAGLSKFTDRVVRQDTLTLQVIAEMQKIGGTCAFIDAEHALDAQYAQKLA